MIVLFFLAYDVVLYEENCYPYGVYESYFSDYFVGKTPCLLKLSEWKKYKSNDLLIITTWRGLGEIKELFDNISVKFTKDTVYLPDTTFVAEDYIFVGKFPNPYKKGKSITIEVGNNVEALGGARDINMGYFSISRKRDGIMYESDLSAIGEWGFAKDKLCITNIKWFKHPERKLRVERFKNIKLYYDGNLFSTSQAHKFARLMNNIYVVYDSIYSIPMPETVFIYVYLSQEERTRYTTYSQPFNTIWSKIEDKESFLKGEIHNPILSYAHEMARVSFQPFSSVYPPSIGADDWSHYAPMVGVIPYLYSIYGDTAWFYSYPYQKNGIPNFEKLIEGANSTYESILYDIDKKYGKEIIGKAINLSIPSPYFRHVDIKKFMKVLCGLIDDRKIKKRIENGFPTPFEHSLFRWKRWKPLGISPEMEEMFWKNEFIVKDVKKGSIADSLGIKPGDCLLQIEGYSVRKKKDWAYRSLLSKNDGDTVFMVFKRGKKNIKLKYIPQGI